MDDGLYYDREDSLWYIRNGYAQVFEWEHGISIPMDMIKVIQCWGPMRRAEEEMV